jgi:hypothetical protein
MRDEFEDKSERMRVERRVVQHSTALFGKA